MLDLDKNLESFVKIIKIINNNNSYMLNFIKEKKIKIKLILILKKNILYKNLNSTYFSYQYGLLFLLRFLEYFNFKFNQKCY